MNLEHAPEPTFENCEIARLNRECARLRVALQNLIKPANGCVGVLWKSADPRDGKYYADQTAKAIKEARAALRGSCET